MSTTRRRKAPNVQTGSSHSRTPSNVDEMTDGQTDYTDDETYLSSAPQSPSTLLVDNKKKWQSLITRAITGIIMILSFLFVVVYLQQPGCMIMVFIFQGLMYKELTTIAIREQTERELPGFKLLYIYWFFVCVFYIYGVTLEQHFLMHSLHHLLGFKISTHLHNHRLYSFLLYCLGLVLFVWSLKKRRHYKYQFKQFAFCHVTLLLIVGQSSLLVSNIFHGMIWFLLPCSLVICNDIFAYFFGFFFGRTPLIRLSPKKTWEGFIGGWMSTMVFSVLFSRFLMMFHLMTCERRGFGLQYWPECEVADIYILKDSQEVLPPLLHDLLPASVQAHQMCLMDIHALWLAMFASVIAPFGGFFASGFKRAFRIKDFGDSIPGHGGITDRMDCQIMMGLFVSTYYNTRVLNASTKDVLLNLVLYLSKEDQVQLYKDIGELLGLAN